MLNAHNPFDPLTKIQKRGLWLFLLLCVLFGAYVELRGALQKTQKTDVGVYFRAAWAVRTGNDIYAITNSRGWHYIYPPLLAIMMVPLADPPPGVDNTGYLPYKVSVGLWYALTLMMGFFGAHVLAKALEDTSADPAIREQPRFCQRWWALRLFPILILFPAIERGQMRGQVDMLLVLLFCMASSSMLRRRRFSAGLWLAASACIKIIPAFLLLLPAWRRDWRMLSGSVIGLIFGLIVIPVIVIGPERTLSGYHTFYQETVLAGLKGDTQGKLGKELTGIKSTDSNAPMVVLHNIMHPIKASRPKVAANEVRLAHWLIALFLTITTLLAAGWKGHGRLLLGQVEATSREVLFLGALIPTMLIASPVLSPHYVSLALPLITVLLSILWDRHSYPNLPPAWKMLFGSLIVSHLLTSIDRGIFVYLRDFGLVLITTLLIWAASVFMLRCVSENLRALSYGKQ